MVTIETFHFDLTAGENFVFYHCSNALNPHIYASGNSNPKNTLNGHHSTEFGCE